MLKHYLKQILLAFFAMLMIVSTTGVGRLKLISFKELPRAARLYINQNYPTGEVENVGTEGVMLARTFKVRMKDGTSLEFDADGEWLEVSSEDGEVSSDVVPCPILYQLRAAYPQSRICKIHRAWKGYDLMLAGGKVVCFNKDYDPIG